MKWTDKDLGILQNLEFCVMEIWRANSTMTDYSASRAFEAAFQLYRAEARGHMPKPPGLSGLDAEIFESLKAMCEYRLGRGKCPVDGPETVPGVPLEQIVDCLREFCKSVERHTYLGGRQGY
ncbi:MAG TPA: hypothetical protein VNV43_04445 [Candidatus Acidoferrales bacterium]|nr:hypothetical protein [Candidatus Acidoferrales bacterium]